MNNESNFLDVARDLLSKTEDEKIIEEKAAVFLRQRSGTVNSEDPLVSFLYELMRDHVTPGDIEKVLQHSEDKGETQYTNGWLAEYAKDIANRLR